MSYSRRDFLKHSGLVSAGLLTLNPMGGGANLWAQSSSDLGIMGSFTGAFAIHQGLSFEDFVYMTILRSRNAQLQYEIVDSQNNKQAYVIIQQAKMNKSDWQLDKIKIINLKLTEIYKIRIVDAKNKVLDERVFKTLDTNKKMPKIAVASCINDFFKGACTDMWAAMQKQTPDLIFMVGDTCYADNSNDGTQLGYWKRYVETRSKLGIFRQKRLTPILAVWDDHDFGGNNLDGSFSGKKFTLELFSTFWLYPEHANYRRGVGVSQVFKAFGQRFFLMDDRYYRNSLTQWGTEQEESLYTGLMADKSPAWIMNGSQYFGGYLKKDAYEYQQAKNFKSICRKLSKIDAPICFVSGDVHFSETMAIEPQVLGYKTFEITSSAMHSFTYPGNDHRKKNVRRLDSTSRHNFNLIKIDNSKGLFKFDVSCHGEDDKTYYKRTMEIKRG